jgi:glycosyltransferase involved in cell wall biosynthesis
MNILHLIPTLGYTGASAQLGLLAKFAPVTHSVRICCLGGEGPWAQRLRAGGQRVKCLNWTRVFDPTPLWKLRRLLKSEPPDLIHAWGLQALRSLGLIARRWLPRTLVSLRLPRQQKNVSRFDRWLLARTGKVVASSQIELAQCRELGVPESSTALVPPGVEIPSRAMNSPVSGEGKHIMCLGELAPRKGFRDAIWAFDILHYLFQDTRLTFVGDGPHRGYLQWLTGCLERSNEVAFLGARDDATALLANANIFWAPTITGSSRQAVLEALAAGRAVVAADHPALREIIADGDTGLLVPPGDKIAVCKRTRGLFLDPALTRQMGDSGRACVARHFAAETCVRQWSEQYAAV